MPFTPVKLLAIAFLAGIVSAPTASWAETTSKAGASKAAAKSGAGNVDEFEENRKAHMTKSKENNDKKGAE